MTPRNILLALLLSGIITFFLVAVYVLYPIISVLVTNASQSAETGGIAAVAGGGSLPGFLPLLLTETVVFAVVFVLLRSKGKG